MIFPQTSRKFGACYVIAARVQYSGRPPVIWKTRVPDSGYRVPGMENAGMENAGNHGKRG